MSRDTRGRGIRGIGPCNPVFGYGHLLRMKNDAHSKGCVCAWWWLCVCHQGCLSRCLGGQELEDLCGTHVTPTDPPMPIPGEGSNSTIFSGEDMKAALSLCSKSHSSGLAGILPSLQDREATPMILPRRAVRARCRKELDTCM